MAQDDTGRSKQKGLFGKLIFATLLLILAATSVVLYLKYTQAQKRVDEAQADQILAQRLSDVIVVPDEQPSIATILDKSKLTNQELAARAENNDKLIIYSKSKKVILYRPSMQKIVDILTIQDTTGQAAAGQ